jgi:phenylacetate-CoA ligase
MRRMGKITGPQRRHADHPRRQRVPHADRGAGAGAGGLSGQYQIVVTRDGALDNVEVRCELLPAAAGADVAVHASALQQRIKTMVGISTKVTVGQPDSIERTLVGKARRVIDQRPR